MFAKEKSAVPAAVNSLDQDGLAKIFEGYAPTIYEYLMRLGIYAQETDQKVGDVFAYLLDKLAEETSPRKHLRSYLFQNA